MTKSQLREIEAVSPPVDEPHFDEEWTVLSARPVVPLEELKPKFDRYKVIKLGLAFISASLLGVFVAVASIRYRETTSSVSEEAVVPVLSQTVESDTSVDDVQLESETALVPQAEAPTVAPKTTAKITETPKRQSVQNVPAATQGEIPNNTADEQSKPSPKLVDQWQERRPRRTIFHRQRRDRDDDLHHRDLLRIDEIFEGQRPRGEY